MPLALLDAMGRRPTVAIFGAGIAGLSAAHELADLGHYEVHVYERDHVPGGMAKSARRPADEGMPSEFSYRGFGPQYRNAFTLMRRVPFGDGTVYDQCLSRPITFAMPGDTLDGMSTHQAAEEATTLHRRFHLTWWDRISLAWLLLRCWCACDERAMRYALENASERLRRSLSPRGWKRVIATFGPWIGIDPARTSSFHAALFFRTNLFPGPSPKHLADSEGPAWSAHGWAPGWSVLKAPSNEAWFDPWVRTLRTRGVTFHFEHRLDDLQSEQGRITAARVTDLSKDKTEDVVADRYVLAINPFTTVDVLARSSRCLSYDEELKKFPVLVQDGPHVQVSLRVAFGEKLHLPGVRQMVILPDSAFDLTLIAQDLVWPASVELGQGVASLWSITACVSYEPGPLYGKPLVELTREQFIEECLHQLRSSAGLRAMIAEANQGRSIDDFPIVRTEVWHEWRFATDDGERLTATYPKWVSSDKTQPHLPQTRTSQENLFLAGAHTRTTFPIWSMEGAAESGRRAAHMIDARAPAPLEQHTPALFRAVQRIDRVLFAWGSPRLRRQV